MKQPKALLTALFLAGLSLAACKPGANPSLPAAAGGQTNAQSGTVIQVNDITTQTVSVDVTQTAQDFNGVDDRLTGTPDSEDTTTPGAEGTSVDDHGQNSGLDSAKDIAENGLSGTPGADDAAGDNNGQNSGLDSSQDLLENGLSTTPGANDDHGQNSGHDSANDIAENGLLTATPGAVVANLGQEQEFSGTITQVGNGFIVVNGQTVWVGANTEVTGTLAIGDTIKVHTFVDGNGALSAREIRPAQAGNATDTNANNSGDNNGGSANSGSGSTNSGSGSGNSGQGGTNSGSGGNNGGNSGGGGQDDGGHGGGHG